MDTQKFVVATIEIVDEKGTMPEIADLTQKLNVSNDEAAAFKKSEAYGELKIFRAKFGTNQGSFKEFCQNLMREADETKAQPHPFEPVFDANSKILLLGSFPSEKSFEAKFFYGHKGNEFWKVLGKILGQRGLENESSETKRRFLLDKNIALWDIFAKCVKVPQDSSMDIDIVPSRSEKVDLSEILNKAKIQHIFTTIDKQCFELWRIEAWIWQNYAKFFPHAIKPDRVITSLGSTSGRAKPENIEQNYAKITEFLKEQK